MAEPNIWLSSPSHLNDPFEFRPKLDFTATRDQLIEAAAQMLKRRNPEWTSHTATAEAVALYLQGRHRDEANLREIQKFAIETCHKEIGLCCLSEVNNSILMWTHYANNHRGYCLQYEATDRTYLFGEAQKVSYSQNYPVVNIFNTTLEEQTELIFFTKFEGWAYEKEWRVAKTTGTGLCSYPADLLKGVIFGLRTNDKDKNEIKRYIKCRGHDVRYYQCFQSEDSFALNIVEVH